MPLIVATAIRYLIMAAVQLPLWKTLEKYGLALLNKAIKETAQLLGLTEQEAEDLVANEFLVAAEKVGVLAITLRTKLPLKIADRLGFTTKGWVKRALKPKAAAVASGGSSTFSTFVRGGKRVFEAFEKRLNTVFLGFLVAGGFLDFGNWETGAYSDTFQKIFQKVTFGLLKPNEDFRQTKTASPEVFAKVYNAYKLEGATEIQDPYKVARVPFTRDNLIDLIDNVGAHLLLTSGGASTKDVLEASQLMIIFGSRPASPSFSTQPPTQQASQTPKAFTGVLSQATIAAAVPFVPRQDDLIENINELESAAKTNEAAFLASLPGRIVREIKIVSSVTTKSGFTQRGTTTQVVSGYNKDGTPKYKTVANKFAVADYYLISERGARTKLTRIVYGPTDGIRFRPEQGQIDSLQASLASTVALATPAITQVLQSPSEATYMMSNSGGLLPQAATVPPPITKIEITPRNYFVNYDSFYTQVFYRDGNHLVASPDFSSILARDELEKIGNYGAQTSEAIRRLKALGYPVDSYEHKKFHNEIDGRIAPIFTTNSFEDFFGAKVIVMPTQESSSVPQGALTASTLSEYYRALGLDLPTISQRSLVYEALNLGKAAYYTGTAEQNVKLLSKLQGKM